MVEAFIVKQLVIGKLSAHRAGFPGKELSLPIAPLIPADKAGPAN